VLQVPAEILKNMPPTKKRTIQDPITYSVAPSQQLLAACFDNIFTMMASEVCQSIESKSKQKMSNVSPFS